MYLKSLLLLLLLACGPALAVDRISQVSRVIDPSTAD